MTHPFFVHTTRVCRRVKFFLFPVYVFSLFVKLRHFFSVDVVGICFLLMCARILLSFPKISRTAWSAAIKVCVTQLTVRNSLEGFPRRFFSLSHSLNNFFFLYLESRVSEFTFFYACLSLACSVASILAYSFVSLLFHKITCWGLIFPLIFFLSLLFSTLAEHHGSPKTLQSDRNRRKAKECRGAL